MSSPEGMTASVGQAPRLMVQVVVPTYNGGAVWRAAAAALAREAAASRHSASVLVVDSRSADDSADIARQHGFEVRYVEPAEFDHGATRNAAVDGHADVVVFLTQDAIAEDGALDSLLEAFASEQVAVAYGRQLPHVDANPIAAHARHFNYPAQGHVAGRADIPHMGIKTAFVSNSFAAYRVSVFQALGGFPARSILSEDMFLAARAVLEGYDVAYVAEAAVRHSHNYSPAEEFRRYFDIGVFHASNPWILQAFGAAEGEGARFIRSELQWLRQRAPLWAPRAFIHNLLKYVGFRLGRLHRALPTRACKAMSMHRAYWARRHPGSPNR